MMGLLGLSADFRLPETKLVRLIAVDCASFAVL